MDQDMNQPIFDALEANDITYRLNEEIETIEGKTVTFKSGKKKIMI